jgi:hypothetical protein
MATDNLMPQSSTSIIKHFMLRSSSTGQGLTGKTSTDFTGKYNIAGGAEVTLSFSGGTVGDAYTSGKIVPLGLGKYAWHVPNALFLSLGNVSAVLSVTGGIDVHCEWLVVAAVRDSAAFGANTTAPDNASITAVKAKTDNLPSDPADQSIIVAATDAILTAVGTRSSQTSVDTIDTVVDAIKVKSDQLTFTVANKVDSTSVLDSATQTQITAIETFATRMTTGLVQDGAVYQFTANMLELGPSGGGGGDATLAKQTEILAAIQGSEVIQVASPNVSGNLVLTQGDDYDGVANPKASWTVTTDYTSGWTVRLTIRSAADAVIYTNTGSVVSSTVVAVTIAAPTGLTMTGCPGQWQGKFDVELTHSSGKKKTIALGTCYINEDQTR